MFSFFNYSLFLKVAYRSFSPSHSRKIPLTPTRIVSLICFFMFFSIVQFGNAVCMALDELIFPAFRKIKLKPPVFILGNGRSGTTHLHRLLAMDEKQFFYFKTWEILFPSILQKKILSFIGRMDSFLGSPGYRLLERKSRQSLNDLSKAHKTGLFVAEECETILVHIFSSYNLIFFFPLKQVFDNYLYFDELLSSDEKRKIMTFYAECVKRQAYFKGNQGRLISKSPGFTSKIDSLQQFFPGCKIVYMIRSPYEVVPSLFSLIQEIYKQTIQIQVDDEILDGVYHLIKNYYDLPLKKVASMSPVTACIINYHDLVKIPYDVIWRLYREFDFEISDPFWELLQGENIKAKQYVSNHQYSLNQFGLLPEKISSDFREIIQLCGFQLEE